MVVPESIVNRITIGGGSMLVRVEISGSIHYRWIVKKRDDGRYIVRAPKIGVRIRDLHLLRNADFGKETLLPIHAKLLKRSRKTRRQR